MDSILISIKKLLGIAEDYEQFDVDIIMHINSVFAILTQLGVGPTEGFYIEDDGPEWSDYLEDNRLIETVRSYMYMKIRLMFDPPTSSAVMDSMNRMISELEWRINVAVDPEKEV